MRYYKTGPAASFRNDQSYSVYCYSSPKSMFVFNYNAFLCSLAVHEEHSEWVTDNGNPWQCSSRLTQSDS